MARLLIAEDEDAVRTFLERAFRARGHEVVAVADGAQALDALAASAEAAPFDLLLTDIVMPHVDGIALALKAGKAFPAMPIVLMTGYAAEQRRAHNLDALVHQVIAKPFDMETITTAVERALAG